MIIKIKNHEKMIRAISAQYDVQFGVNHGKSSTDVFVMKNTYTRKTVNIVITDDATFYQCFIRIWREQSYKIIEVFGRDYAQLMGTMATWLQCLYSYEEPLYFTTELFK